ncbi:Fe-S cluster assembly ATPase SufC [Lacticaseibacillus brantae]|uniref:Fe-S cluster assembly ABC-type transport system, ATPase component n=1 Tax=Lacticaseibacillus brantae DSM 23927 TaxID=1423727 RepID=A0A0R2B0R2_9LACO|nr:Fe-S cluster assembly ATPase SufC [Lacticaseibacillus brantae]KRM72928.1 Fe-S cluster assembly ABC-type transport system, ATPase component [Lacticaseibacillus brantae DSM 23927]
MQTLTIEDLHVKIKAEPKHPEILNGVNLTINTGEVHAIMGPNGTGKSTLEETIMGNPAYEVTQGDIQIDGQSILNLPVDERARAGLFLGMQYPSEIAGVTNAEFIRAAINARRPEDDPMPIMSFLNALDETMATLEMPTDMADRYLNQGFSGGEKKRNEILQLMMIQPSFALLDEIDSGLDIDALRIVAKGVNLMRGENFASLIITHYQRLLDYIVPDVVHVMKGGHIIETGGPELALELEKTGYEHLGEA